ncbi:MAG: hypothetical protein DA407_16290 [Bacteroidetes bacterium]|nr:MAG: hypothetical protein DA407_16290 [Bacteroidota bacterium]
MNFNLTLENYLDLISCLTIQDIIIYYFFAYLFISVIKKILNQEIGLDGVFSKSKAIPFKAEPKILLTLELIYIFGIATNYLDNYLDLDDTTILFLIIFGFIVVLFFISHLIEKIVYRLIFSWKIKSKSKKTISHELKMNKRIAVVDKIKLKNSSSKYAKINRNRLNVAIINFNLTIILLINSMQISLVAFFIILILSIFNLSSHYKLIKKILTDLGNSGESDAVKIIP